MRQTSSPTSKELRNSTDSWWAWRKCNTGGKWNRLCDPSAVQAHGFVPASLNWNEKDDWQKVAKLFSREVMGYQVGGLWTFTQDFHPAHIWNIQFLWSTVIFSKFSLNYPLWQHHYLGDYYMLCRRFGFFIFPIVDNSGSAPQRTAHRIDSWQSMMHLLHSPHSSLTLLQINLKAGGNSCSHQMPYQLPWFLLNSLFVS